MSDKPSSFRVYDTETTGLSAFHDQVIQFAGVGVDADLQYIPGDEIHLDITLRHDVVPSPYAFAVHGISINRLMDRGITEFEAASHIRNWFMSTPNAMITGFNSLSFDDEVIRNMFYRTMLDPYEHEWKNSNGRMDVFRLIQMVFALRPELMRWPINNEGKISLKLGDLCSANGIELKHAHDARFDVIATIELMRLVKDKSPRLWDYYLKLTTKDFSKRLAEQLKPLVLVDRYLPREQGHMSIVLPIIYDAKTPNKMLCVDLRSDPSELLELSPDEIRRRLFTSISDLPEGESISCIRDITMNKQPMISELSVLNGRQDLVQRSALDIEKCLAHAEIIKNDKGFRARLQDAFKSEFEPCKDVYQGIYSLGLIGKDEQGLRSRTRRMTEIKGVEMPMPEIITADPFTLSTAQVKDGLRMFELSLRAKWSNFGEEVLATGSYTPAEIKEWATYLDRCWEGEPRGKHGLNLEKYAESLKEVRATFALTAEQEKALDELECYVQANAMMRESMQNICAKLTDTTQAEDHISLSAESLDAQRKSREARANASSIEFT